MYASGTRDTHGQAAESRSPVGESEELFRASGQMQRRSSLTTAPKILKQVASLPVPEREAEEICLLTSGAAQSSPQFQEMRMQHIERPRHCASLASAPVGWLC